MSMNVYGYCFDYDDCPWECDYYTSPQSAYKALQDAYADNYESWSDEPFPSFEYVMGELWNNSHVVVIGEAYLFECYVETR